MIDQLLSLWESPLCVICCFSLAAFNICSLSLIFVNLINMCLGVFHLGFILFGPQAHFGVAQPLVNPLLAVNASPSPETL